MARSKNHRSDARRPRESAARTDRAARDATRGESDSFRAAGWLLAAAIALVVARPFVPGMAIAQEGYGAIFVVLWFLLVAAWLVSRLKGVVAPIRFHSIDGLVLAFFVLYGLSGVVAAVRVAPRPAVNVTWHWLSVAAAYFLFRQLLRGDVLGRAAVAVVIALATAMAVLGLEQVMISLPEARAVYARYKDDPRELFQHVGRWLPEGSTERQQFEARLNAAEPTATMALTNSLAGMLAPAMVLAIGILAHQLRSPTGRRALVWLILPLSALGGCLAYTHSRSGMLAAVLASLAAVLLTARHRVVFVAAVGLVALLAGTAVWMSHPTAITNAVRSLSFRLEYWRSTWDILADYPLFGCGPGQFQDTYTAYKLPTASEEVADPHNFLLEVWATGGTAAAAVMVAALIAVGWLALRRRRPDAAPTEATEPPATLPVAFVYAGAFGGVLLGAAAAWLDEVPIPSLQIGLSIAAVAAALAVLHGWMRGGDMPRLLPLVVAAGLLLHLFVSGGIGEPALASLLWLLLAVQLNHAVPATSAGIPHALAAEAHPPPVAWTRAGALLLVILLTAAAYVTYYRPVVTAAGHLSRAEAAAMAGQDARRLEALREAFSADRWSIHAARQLAALHFANWQQTEGAQPLTAWQEADRAALRLAPRRHGLWRESAERYAMLATRGDRDAFAQALAHIERAIALYPTHADHHLLHAELLFAADRREAAARALTRAVELDDAKRTAGHLDRTLPQARRAAAEELARQLAN